MLKLIQAISKKDQVVAAIKDAILSGAIEPGDQIVESRMAQQLGSGIPLVREALIALEHRSEEHTSELQSRGQLVCRLLHEKKNTRLSPQSALAEWVKSIWPPTPAADAKSR